MELHKKQNRYKWIAYVAVLFLLLLTQSTVFSGFRVFGGAPQFLPYAIGVIAMLEGLSGAAAAGFAAGLMMDAMTAPTEGFYTLVYVLCGIAVYLVNLMMYQRSFTVSLIFWAVVMLISDFAYYLVFMLTMEQAGISALFRMFPGQICSTVLFTPLIYWCIRKIYERFRTERE